MRRLFALAGIGLFVLAIPILVQSCGVLGGPPGNVQIQADSTGVGVAVIWTAPTEGLPDQYTVYFKALGDTTEVVVAETTATVCNHQPNGLTGTYRVVAEFDAKVYEGRDQPSTVPVFNDTVTLYELNRTEGVAGYGWDRVLGNAGTYDMRESGSASGVDFYVTDTRAGSSSQPFSIFSPAARSKDQGASGVIPDGTWKQGYYTDHIADEHAVLPAIADSMYYDYTDITASSFISGCFLDGNYFALLKVTEVDYDGGTVKLVSWFQKVPGLRLIRH
jgi:hypothetical protein